MILSFPPTYDIIFLYEISIIRVNIARRSTMDFVNYGANRWKIVFGCYNGVEKQAVNYLYKNTAQFFAYVLTVAEAKESDVFSDNVMLIGTPASNPHVKKLCDEGALVLPAHEEGYRLVVKDGVFAEGKKAVIVAANNAVGVLYGVVEFCNKILAANRYTYTHNEYLKNPFDKLPDVDRTQAPAFNSRAVWTWGHVIYDYRKFIDNMVTLRMNMLVVWNDYLPYNVADLIDHAHANGVKVVLGFAWGWGEETIDISAPDFCEEMAERVLAKYENDYAKLDIDGLYFQSLTETQEDTRNGVVIAERIAEMVNLTFKKLHAKYPAVSVQFGLHATSVKNKLDYIKRIDPALSIVWEDCGAFPYKYLPHDVQNLDETLRFTQTIATLRGKEDKFGVVLKGLTALNWSAFEHQKGNYVLGVRNKRYLAERTAERNKIWKMIQAYWLENADALTKTLQAIHASCGAESVIEGLLEDGMLEEGLFLPAIVLGEAMWDPDRELPSLLRECMLYPDAAFASETF